MRVMVKVMSIPAPRREITANLIKRPVRLIFVFALFLMLAPGCTDSKKAAEEGRPVILVGSRTITVKEYRSALDKLLPTPLTEISAEEMKDLKENVVAQLIQEALLLDEATKLGVTVSEEELSRE